MKPPERARYRELFEQLEPAEQRRLLKRAERRMRAAERDADARGTRKRQTRVPRHKRREERAVDPFPATVDDWALLLLADELAEARAALDAGAADAGAVDAGAVDAGAVDAGLDGRGEPAGDGGERADRGAGHDDDVDSDEAGTAAADADLPAVTHGGSGLVRALARSAGAAPTARRGVVVSVYSGCCDVRLDDRELLCDLVADLARTQKTTVAVGDEVLVHDVGSARWLVTTVLPRRTLLSRPDPHDPAIERVIAANIDIVCIVVSLVAPPLHPRLIDRMLVGVQRGGAEPLIVVNKVDLADEDELEVAAELLLPYADIDVPIVFVSAEQHAGLDELRDHLRGRICAFVGHSGVGKSSLVNAIYPIAAARTGEVRERDGRGRHTTSASRLYRFDDGTQVADTPGIRSFGLWLPTAEELRSYFPEFDEVALRCRFSDCTHTHEPDCAVREAVEAGEVSEYRYETWVRILEDEDA